ncbi:MAG: hypothetical protein KC419_15625 [Anaerolineales bacterium]|nr:hypothetical protein [Anaerolineales bacterium]MCA9929913.1 hypothetical protein [Anaerolineales bacterium]
MKRYDVKFNDGYLALMLGLGVNPVVTVSNEVEIVERPYPSLKAQLKKTHSQLTSRWHRGQGMKWDNITKPTNEPTI